jgi:hypothetical protein
VLLPVRTRISGRIAAAALGPALFAPTAALADYRVHCDRGRIAVDSRTPEQMRMARGSSFCPMGEAFRSRMDAQTFARRNFGGEGRACSCR